MLRRLLHEPRFVPLLLFSENEVYPTAQHFLPRHPAESVPTFQQTSFCARRRHADTLCLSSLYKGFMLQQKRNANVGRSAAFRQSLRMPPANGDRKPFERRLLRGRNVFHPLSKIVRVYSTKGFLHQDSLENSANGICFGTPRALICKRERTRYA